MIVLIDKPLQRAMSSPKAVGQMVLRTIVLSKFDIQYRLHIAMKGQVVADFNVEFTNVEGQGIEEHPQWSIHTNRSSKKKAS